VIHMSALTSIAPISKEPLTKQSVAVLAFLTEVRASGEIEIAVPVLEAQARSRGLLGKQQSITSSKPFKRAKRKLGIQSRRVGFGANGQWIWRLVTQPDIKPKLAAPVLHSNVGPEDAYAVDHSRLSLPPKNEGLENEFLQPSEIPPEWTHGLMILETRPVPRDVPQRLWDQFVSDARWFIRSPEKWASRARGLGWSTSNLFACASVRPFDYLASAGLLWHLRGGRLKTLFRHSAIFVDATGTEHTFDRHRRPSLIATTLPWILQ
jgi:hypothetical protein